MSGRIHILLALALGISSGARAEVGGRVYSTTGEPLVAATVEAYALERAEARAARLLACTDRSPVARSRVDEAGFFRLEGVPPVVELAVHARGFAPGFETVADSAVVTVTLEPAPTVEGTVRSGGQPVAGAMVTWTTGESFRSGHVWTARTRDDGIYEIPDPAVWARGLVITHPGFAPLELSPGPWEPPPALDHELEPGVTLAGAVAREANGQPLAGASVAVDGWPLARSSTDGSFVLPHAPRLWHRLVAWSGGLVGESGPAADPVVLAMKPAAALAGIVRDSISSAPLVNAEVMVQDEEWTPLLTAITDSQGLYRFDHLMPGHYYLRASRAGYGSTGFEPLATALDLHAGRLATEDVSLSPLDRVAGRVEDEHGQPVAGALVLAWRAELPIVYARDGVGGGGWPATWTRPDGHFFLTLEDDDEAESTPALLVLKPGFAGQLETLGPDPHVVRLTRGVELSGRVTTPRGEPLAGVSVVLVEEAPLGTTTPLEPGTMEQGWVRSGPDGRFVVRVRPVPHHVVLRVAGRVPRSVRHPTPDSPMTVVLEPAASIRGRIVRGDGSGVSAIQVVLAGDTPTGMSPGRTARDGTFAFEELAPGTYELYFHKPGTALMGSRTVTAPDGDLRLDLGPSATLRGRVTDASTHAPIVRFSVEATPALAAGPWSYGTTLEAGGGTFTLEEVPEGALDLVVRAEGFAAYRLERLTVTRGDDGSPLDIELDRGARIQGFVTAEDGSPLSEVQVSAQGEDDEARSAITDTRGFYDIVGLAPGRVRVEFRRSGYLTTHTTLAATDLVQADVTLDLGLVLEGVVLSDGLGVAGASVSARSSVVDAEGLWATTDEEGRFTLEGLAPGRHTIEASTDDGGEVVLPDVDVGTAGFLRLSLQRPETAVLSGWVTGLPEDDAKRTVTVQVRGDDGRGEQAGVDATGWFRMENAPAGVVLVDARVSSFQGPGRSTGMRELTLPAGSEVETILEFPEGYVVSGHVLRDGAPAPGVRVRFRAADSSGLEASDRSDRDGRYEVAGLEPGPYHVQTWDLRSSFSTEYTVTGHDELDLDITTGALVGSVLDASDGSPLPGAAVTLWRLGPGEAVPDQSLTSNVHGEFVASSLEEGRYRVLASREGFGQGLREVELRRGTTVEVTLELEASEGLTLEVVDARDGRSLDASVVVRDMARRIVANRPSRVGDGGALNVPLAPGPYILSTCPVTVPAAGLRLGLTPGGTLVLESERPLRGRVRLVGADGEEYVRCWCNGLADIDLEGRRTRVEHVTPGSYTLQILEDGGAPAATTPTATIREGETVTVVVP
jgi:protocatechuate 3,4-dioxygenase beta subunit